MCIRDRGDPGRRSSSFVRPAFRLAEFHQNAERVPGVEEGDLLSARTFAGSAIDEADASRLEFLQRAFDIFHLEGDVLDSLAALFDETRHRAVRRGRFEKFHFRVPDGQKDRFPLLFVNGFLALNLQTQESLVQPPRRLRIFHGDEVTPQSLMASACLPMVFQAVEIDDKRWAWVGTAGASVLTSLADADGLALIPPEALELPKGPPW